MALNDPDNIYGTQAQIEFARKMAESLLSGKGGFKGLPADVARIPYAGVNYGGMNILNAIQGAQYRDIAGSQETARKERLVPGNEDFRASVTRGNPIPRTSSLSSNIPGVFTPPSITPGQEDKRLGEAPVASISEPTTLPAKSASIYDALVNEVKKSENTALFNGAQTESKAYKDFKQHSIGYGTKANNPNETINKEEAEKRFSEAWGKAEATVDKFKPGLDPGTRAALVSLTYNSGPGWTQSGLGQAIKKGDMNKAKEIFKKYNMAGGKVNQQLVARRQKESQWFGQGMEEPGLIASAPELKSAPPIPLQTGAIPSDVIPKVSGISTDLPAPLMPPIPPIPAPGPPSMSFVPSMPRTAALPPSARPSISDISPQGAYPVPEIPKTPEPIIPKTLDQRVPETTEPQIPAKAVVPPPARPPVNAAINSPQAPGDISGFAKPGIAPNLDPAAIDRAGKLKEIQNRNNTIEDMLSKIPGIPPSQRTNLGGPDMSGRMNLGGPQNLGAEGQPTAPGLAPGQQISQAGGQYRSDLAKPTENQEIITIPGYKGPAPPMPPVMTPRMLRERLMGTTDSEGEAKVLDDYNKSLSQKEFKVPGGRLIGMPRQGGPAEFTFLPEGEPAQPGGIVPRADKPGPGYGLAVPGSGDDGRLTNRPITGPETGWQTFIRDKAQQDTENAATTGLAEGKVKIINAAIEQGMTAQTVVKTINTMDSLSKSLSVVPRGPTSPFMTAIRQFGDNFSIPIPANTGGAEALQKLNAGLASQATRAISNRGTNFELETFMKNNPGLLQTKDGMEMLLDIMRQEYQGYQDIAKIAGRMKGKDVDTFTDKVDEYYKNNPVKFTFTFKDGTKGRVNTKQINGPEDIEGLKSGEYFLDDKGRVGKKP